MERERDISKHEAIVQPFIKDAFKEGAHRPMLKGIMLPEHTRKRQYFRQLMIGVVYNDIGSTATLDELAEKYGTFKQSIAASNKVFLRDLWNNCSPELQHKYPLNEIRTARKPLSQKSRERLSSSKGGISLKIKAQVESGVKERGEISKNTGISMKKIAQASSTILKDWGVIVPIKYARHEELLAQLDKETDDEKIQELLDELPYNMVVYDFKKKRYTSRFYTLTNLIREAGFHLNNRDTHFFANSLRDADVPISIKEIAVKGHKPQIYYIILSRHKDRAIQALKQDQCLQRFQAPKIL